MTDSTRPPVWFWVVAVIALLWNLAGVGNYLAQAFATPDMLAAMPEHQREYMENTPSWVIGCFAIAVWGGTLASIFMLMRKKLAYMVFIVSLIGVIGQVSHSLLFSNAIEVYGPGGLVLPIFIVLIGVALVVISKKAIASGWLR